MSSQGISLKEQYLFEAKLAQHAERYYDMVDAMKKCVKELFMNGLTATPLNNEVRELFLIAYNNVTGPRRSGWRLVSSVIERGETETEPCVGEKCMLEIIEAELKNTCFDVLEILSTHLIKKSKEDTAATIADDLVFYLTMQGDFYRYLIEVTEAEEKDNYAEYAKNAYKEATAVAEVQMSYAHPIRLELARQYSVFYYQILNLPETACDFIKKTFDNAVTDLDNLDEETFNQSTIILQKLRENLFLWRSEEAEK